jgi:hypothetical protein
MSPHEQAGAIQDYMAQCNGSETLYKHWLGIKYSSGIKFVADTAGAYWLIDAIASHQRKARYNQRLQELQIWFLRRNKKNRWTLSCYEDTGEGEKPKILQRIEYSDFPMDEIKLYVENGVLLLPQER